MLRAGLKGTRGRSPVRRRVVVALGVVAVGAVLAACGDDSSDEAGGSGDGASKLIVATMGFQCSLNDFAESLCEGFEAGEKALPEGFEFQLKTGTDYADQTAYNNLIQTSMQLNPGGMVVFPGGPVAQVPLLKQACDKEIKI